MDSLLFYISIVACIILIIKMLCCRSSDEMKLIVFLLLIFAVVAWLEYPEEKAELPVGVEYQVPVS